MSLISTPWNLVGDDWDVINISYPALTANFVITVTDAVTGKEMSILSDNIRLVRPLTETEAELYPSAMSALYTEAASNANWSLTYIIQSEDFVMQLING